MVAKVAITMENNSILTNQLSSKCV